MGTYNLLVILALFASLCYADYFSNQLPASCGQNRRIRQSWDNLSDRQKEVYILAVLQMKQYSKAWKAGDTALPIYDFFTTVHSNPGNSRGWHGTSFFLPAHRYLLFTYESAIILTAYQNYKAMGITIDEACAITLPYWDWVTYFDPDSSDTKYPMADAPIFNDGYFGSAYTNKEYGGYVEDGYFTWEKWETLNPTCSDANWPDNPDGANYDNYLKRSFDSENYPLTTGPLQIQYALTNYKTYKSFAAIIEGGPHGSPHLWIGYHMSLMFSPDDPLFWMNHCNIDRLYLFWIDCNEFDNVGNESITSTHYYAGNPINPNGYVAYNPYTLFPTAYKVTADSQIPFYYKSNGDSLVFPSKRWPTPRQVWGKTPGAKGYDGIYYAYGKDALVTALPNACPANKKWSLVNQGVTKKRSDEEETILSPSHALLAESGKRFEEEIAKGRSHEEVLHSMAVAECEKAPQIKITQKLLNWISMNNLHISAFDTLCDKPSERLQNNEVQKSNSMESAGTGNYVPLWVIITASIASALVMIAIVTLIILYFRKTNQVTDDSYIVMKE